MGGTLVVSGKNSQRESFDEACAIFGVEPEASLEEIERLWKVKINFAHPDHGGDPERFKRLEKARAIIIKVKGKA